MRKMAQNSIALDTSPRVSENLTDSQVYFRPISKIFKACKMRGLRRMRLRLGASLGANLTAIWLIKRSFLSTE